MTSPYANFSGFGYLVSTSLSIWDTQKTEWWLLSCSFTNTAPSVRSDITRYNYNVSFGSGLISRGAFVRYSLTSSKAFWHSGPHSKFLEPFKTAKNGRAFSANLEINRRRAAIQPVSFWISLMHFSASMSMTAWIFSGLASIPRGLIIYPRNFALATPKVHLFGLIFMLFLYSVSKHSLRSSAWSANSNLTIISSI